MVFFNLDPNTNKLTSASQAWVFAAITIPLTIAVFAVWILWRRRRSKVIEGEMKTRSRRQQDDDIEAGVINNEGFIAGGLQEEALPLQPMNNEGARRKFSTGRR